MILFDTCRYYHMAGLLAKKIMIVSLLESEAI